MPYVISIGVGNPKYRLTQKDAKELVKNLYPNNVKTVERLLPIFDHALIEERQFVIPIEWFEKGSHSLRDRNELYIKHAIEYSIEAIKDCVSNESFLKEEIDLEAIDGILFISSTGIATPTIDSYIINELNMKDDIVRIPIFGLGCGGGASGVARAAEWLRANPTKAMFVINLEFCSLAFQKEDNRKSNFVGTALFGDGISCTLMAGDNSNIKKLAKLASPYVVAASSKMKKNSLKVMGWDVRDSGFHVIFEKSIPAIVKSFWKEHIADFTKKQSLQIEGMPFFVAHPGGAKVLEAMEEVLQIKKEKLKFSYRILRKHGNMSSPTVIFCLKEAMLSNPEKGTKSLLTALGPGFSSEILLLEWNVV